MNLIFDNNTESSSIVETIKPIFKESKRKPFAEKIARATAILAKTGLPEIEISEQTIFCWELRETLLELDFEDLSDENEWIFNHKNSSTTLRWQQCAQESWLPEVLVNDFSEILSEKNLIEEGQSLLEKIKSQRLFVEI